MADLIWRDTSNGVTAIWQMNYSGVRQGATFPGGAGMDRKIQQVRDVNGDSYADLVWRNPNTGGTATWLMNSDALRGDASFPEGAGSKWELQA